MKKINKNVIPFIKNIIKKSIILVVVLGPGMYFGIYNDAQKMFISIIGGAIVVSFWNIDIITKIKGPGFELVKAQKVIDDSLATIEQLKKVTVMLLESSLKIIIYSSTYGGIPSGQKKIFLKDVTSLISDLNINSNEKLGKTKDQYICFLGLCFLFDVTIPMNKELNITKFLREQHSILFNKMYYGKCTINELPSKEIIDDKIASFNESLEDKSKDLLLIYYDYLDNYNA